MWYCHGMKRYGACSLKEGGPGFGRPAPLQFGSTNAEGRVDEQTQVVDFLGFSRFFLHVWMLGERDRPGRRVWRLAKHLPGFFFPAGAGRGAHPAATGTVALPRNQKSAHWDLLAFIRGSTLPFLKVQNRLMQVVDFHDSFRYFRCPFEVEPEKLVAHCPIIRAKWQMRPRSTPA